MEVAIADMLRVPIRVLPLGVSPERQGAIVDEAFLAFRLIGGVGTVSKTGRLSRLQPGDQAKLGARPYLQRCLATDLNSLETLGSSSYGPCRLRRLRR